MSVGTPTFSTSIIARHLADYKTTDYKTTDYKSTDYRATFAKWNEKKHKYIVEYL